MVRIIASVLLPAFLMVGSQAALGGTAKDPGAWLEQMSAAMSHMNYQGTFVYIHGDQLETVRITHVTGDEGVRERMVSLSGTAREMVRDSDGVRWVLGDEASVLSDSTFNPSVFPQLPPDLVSQAGKSYTFKFGAETRVAGHGAKNVKVLPRDHYRYGYSLWLEKNSGMLLKWELVDARRKALAQLMFTELLLGSEIDRDELLADDRSKEFKTVKSGLPDAGSGNSTPPRFKPARIPPGFTLINHRYVSGDEGEYEHLVYSDGLAAVSVYVESLGENKGHPELTQQHGTTHAYTRASDQVMITVVGNVPAVTVEMIGQSVAAVPR